MKGGHVYIMTKHSRTLYTGVTSQLGKRVLQHKSGEGSGFTKTYSLNKLVYLEEFSAMKLAIARGKQIKR